MELLNQIQNSAILLSALLTLFMAVVDPDRVTSNGKVVILSTSWVSMLVAVGTTLAIIWG